MRNQIVILAGGQGKRMNNPNIPKILVSLKGKPLVLYLLEELEKINQLAKPVIVVGYMHDKVQAVLGENYLYALQERQLGTAHAALSAKNKVKAENILVLYGDMPFIKADSLKKLMLLHHQKAAKISMFTATVPSFESDFSSLNGFGRIIRDAHGSITKITEFKDATEKEKQIKEVNPGIYMFNTGWLWKNIDQIKNHNTQNEYYLTDIVEVAIKQGQEICSLSLDPKEVLGVNTEEQLRLAEKLL